MWGGNKWTASMYKKYWFIVLVLVLAAIGFWLSVY